MKASVSTALLVCSILLVPKGAGAEPCSHLIRPALGSPLETLASVPQVECGSSDGGVGFGIFTDVSNTAVIERRYVFDTELFQAAASSSIPITPELDFVTALPFRSRGTGTLDSAIGAWHDAFGLPEGNSDELGEDDYRVRARRTNGELVTFSKHEFTLANLMVGIAGDVQQSDATSWLVSFSLPTASDTSGHHGVNTHVDIQKRARFGRWEVRGELGGSLLGDDELDGVHFNRVLWRAHPAIQYRLTDDFLVETLFKYARTAVRDVPAYPNEMFSVDLRIIATISPAGSFIVYLREDLGGANAQADIVTGLSWITAL